jgi:hypothetical protein
LAHPPAAQGGQARFALAFPSYQPGFFHHARPGPHLPSTA